MPLIGLCLLDLTLAAKSVDRELAVFSVDIDADSSSSGEGTRQQRRAAAHEWIQDNVTPQFCCSIGRVQTTPSP